MSAEGIVGKLPSYHLLLFTIQLEELLKTYLPPIPVYLLTNNTAALDLMTNALSIYFRQLLQRLCLSMSKSFLSKILLRKSRVSLSQIGNT